MLPGIRIRERGRRGGGALPISLEMSLFCMDCYSGKNCVSSEGCF